MFNEISKDIVDFMQPVGRAQMNHYRVIQIINFRGRIWKPGRTVAIHRNTADKYLKEGKIIELPEPKFVDIFKTNFKMPEKVIILGSGPKGKLGWGKISKDDFVIACNGALTCQVPKIDIWAAMDPSLHTQKYFSDLMFDYYRKYYLRKLDLSHESIGKGYPIPVMEGSRVARYFPWVRCVFELRKPAMMAINNVDPHRGYLRPGCTIAGAMVQMAYLLGSKKIFLCGIDMFGNIYHDGSKHKKPERAGKAWGVVGIFNKMMRNLENKGIEFYTLSETLLDVKRYE